MELRLHGMLNVLIAKSKLVAGIDLVPLSPWNQYGKSLHQSFRITRARTFDRDEVDAIGDGYTTTK
jgi:hypothetical protein